MSQTLLTALCLCPAGLLVCLLLWSIFVLAARADEEMETR